MAPRTTTKKPASVPKAPAPTKRTSTTSVTRPPARQLRANPKATSNGVAAKPSSTDVVNKSGLPKLGKGGLAAQVLDHMATNPKSDYTSTDLARVLKGRSSGAIANALAKFATEGKVVQTSERPRRYRLAGARAVRKTSARAR